MACEICSEPREQFGKAQARRAPSPRHETLHDNSWRMVSSNERLKYDMGELVAIRLAGCGGADEDQLVDRVRPTAHCVGALREELQPEHAPRLTEIVREIVARRRNRKIVGVSK